MYDSRITTKQKIVLNKLGVRVTRYEHLLTRSSASALIASTIASRKRAGSWRQ